VKRDGSASRLLVRRATFFGAPPRSEPPHDVSDSLVDFADLKRRVSGTGLLRHLFRYAEVELFTQRLEHLSKPFATYLLLRLLSRGVSRVSDDSGRRIRIGLLLLARELARYLRDLARIPVLLGAIDRRVRALGAEPRRVLPPLDLTRPPLYLRTDLVFDVASGGSVGHIAGVLNSLDGFTARPLFVTTDPIPTTRSDIETHVVPPRADFCGFPEIPSFFFNYDVARRAIAALAGRPAAFVYHRYATNSFAGLEIARRLGVPFVLEYNGSEVWINRNWGEPLRYERRSLRIEELLLKAAELVVVVSETSRAELVARGVKPGRVLVNPNGVDADRYSPSVDGEPVRRRHGLAGKRVIGFIGSFGPWHGAEVLADAFGTLIHEHPDWRESVRLLMIGDGPALPRVRALLERHGVAELSVLTGATRQQDGPAHLAACDLLVSPHVPNADGTPFFGSPTKLFEYMAMARGIVASRLGQISDVLAHDETGWLVEPGDVGALADGLERLLVDEPLRCRLGEAARRVVVERFTWREHARRLVERLQAVSRVQP
jgi:glycosyltransferase involved in cell wall biosynthesis